MDLDNIYVAVCSERMTQNKLFKAVRKGNINLLHFVTLKRFNLGFNNGNIYASSDYCYIYMCDKDGNKIVNNK